MSTVAPPAIESLNARELGLVVVYGYPGARARAWAELRRRQLEGDPNAAVMAATLERAGELTRAELASGWPPT